MYAFGSWKRLETGNGQVNNDRVPIDSPLLSKKRCGDNDNSDCFSEPITDLEEWTNSYVSNTPPREPKWAIVLCTDFVFLQLNWCGLQRL